MLLLLFPFSVFIILYSKCFLGLLQQDPDARGNDVNDELDSEEEYGRDPSMINAESKPIVNGNIGTPSASIVELAADDMELD